MKLVQDVMDVVDDRKDGASNIFLLLLSFKPGFDGSRQMKRRLEYG